MTFGFEVTSEDREAMEALARLPLIEYDRAREAAADRLGIRKSVLDKKINAIRARHGDNVDNLQGTALTLPDPDPWPEAVDGAVLLNEIVAAIRRYVALDEHLAEVIALWVLHTHAHDATEVSPVLAITSPVHRCGKTQLLQVLSGMVPRAIHASNVTPAAIFRTVDLFRPTLLLDEGDTYLTKDELRGVLNAGHVRATAKIVRAVGDEHEPRVFSVWAPKAVAKIGPLTGRWTTLGDRSIEIPMRRRSREEMIENLRLDQLHRSLGPTCQRAWRWSRDHRDALLRTDPIVPAQLNDRATDNARPLLAIAHIAAGNWPERARLALLSVYGMRDPENEDAGIQLLTDCLEVFTELDQDRIASKAAVEYLLELENRPWPEWSHGRGLTASSLARLLNRFGIKPKKMRLPGQGKPVRGYAREDFESHWVRYLDCQPVAEAEHTEHLLQPNEDPDPTARNSASYVPLPESRESL